MYDYGIFRYPLYLVLCPQLSPCMIMGYFVTLSILFFVSSLLCSRTICSFLLGHDVNISLILFTLGFALRILYLSAVPMLYLFLVVEYAWVFFSTMSQEYCNLCWSFLSSRYDHLAFLILSLFMMYFQHFKILLCRFYF